jgi:MFS superfamily sulfate permease-like transporter
MKEKIKRKIIFALIITTIAVAPLNIAYGVYFGVLTNLLINAFWNSKLFPPVQKEQSKEELITEAVGPPRL